MQYLVIAALLVVAWVVIVYNKLVKYRMLMREAMSGIDVQLKRRHDLVPVLVESAKGYATHEKELFQKITDIRAKTEGLAGTAEKNSAESELSQGIKAIFAVAEAYPDLKASANFLKLQRDLVNIEDQLQLARRYYNGTVRNYNILAQSFPNNVISSGFGFRTVDFFEIEYATERTVPDVKFNI